MTRITTRKRTCPQCGERYIVPPYYYPDGDPDTDESDCTVQRTDGGVSVYHHQQ